jgi:hypothetical protein
MSSPFTARAAGYAPPPAGREGAGNSSSGEWECGSRRPSVRRRLRRPATRAARRHRLARAAARLARDTLALTSDDDIGVTGSAASIADVAECKALPPSLIVPEPEIGSASDAAVLPQDRAVHRNRRRATILLFETLDPDGRRTGTCADFQKFFSRHSLYTKSLNVPKVERDVEPCRAPANHLSHELQNKRSVRPGGKRVGGRGHRRRKGAGVEAVCAAGPPECSWDDDRALNDSFAGRSTSCDAESGAGGGDPVSPPSRHGLVKRRRVVDPVHDPVLQPEEDLFTALFAQARSDPSASLRDGFVASGKREQHLPGGMFLSGGGARATAASPRSRPNGDGGPASLKRPCSDGHVAPRGDGDRNETSDGAELSPFDKSLLSSLQFSGATKRIHVDASGRQSVVPAWSTLPAGGEAARGFGDFELHTKRFGSKYLDKFGFTGRLGAAGQGISDPLEGRPAAGRSGLGARRGGSGGLVIGDEVIDVDAHRDLDGVASTFAANEGHIDVGRGGRKRGRRRRTGPDANGLRRSDAGGDLFASRRRHATGPSLLQEDADDWKRKVVRRREAAPEVLDEGDDVETCEEWDAEEGFDNGRRGILLDFDALVKGAQDRRVKAFRLATAEHGGIPDGFDVTQALCIDGRDVSDEHAARHVLTRNNMEASDAACDALLDRVDRAFGALAKPAVDEALLAALKAVSQKVHVGVLHRGTKRRLNRELRDLDLSTAFNTRKMVLHHSDAPPYTRSWRELLCRLGVSARQSLFVVGDSAMSAVPSFAVAGHILGARTMVYVDSTNENFAGHVDLDGAFDARHVVLDKAFGSEPPSFADILKDQARRRRRRRVLALYSTEGLWFAGRVEFESRLPRRANDKLLVRYYKWDNLEWVAASDTVPLVRRDYARMAANGFGGLLDSEDVATLEELCPAPLAQ